MTDNKNEKNKAACAACEVKSDDACAACDKKSKCAGETLQPDPKYILEVHDIKKYFPIKKSLFGKPLVYLKAVDNVSFSVKPGTTIGVVGESGCGKTTTGRSIIRLYDITSGSVYFKGVRVSAGIGSYRDAVKKARAEYRARLKELNALKTAEKKIADNETEIEDAEKQIDDTEKRIEEAELLVVEAEEKYHTVVKEQTENIRSAVYDDKNFDKDYRKERVNAITKEYDALIAEEGDEEKKAALEKEKKELEITILQEKIKKPFLTKEQIRFGIEKFGKLDISTKEGKQRLIDGFINAIYVYDDKITFTFNYKDGTRTVMLSELSDGKNNSDLKCQGAPSGTRTLGPMIKSHLLYQLS